jgi:two-component system, OmpR family, phosphate regulon sensor histidine kinase PhoR
VSQSEGLQVKRRNRATRGFGYRRIVTLLVALVIVPTVLMLLIGIILMFLGEAQWNLLFGILTVSFVAAVVTGVVLVLVFLRRAANLSELQADFISKVSHELRTPLTAIRLFVETLERSKDDPLMQEKCITQLSTESERLTQLIERLLDWGRMEAGGKLYELQAEQVASVIEDARSGLAAARYPEARIRVEIPNNLPAIFADRPALADAVRNLISNACKYGGAPPEVLITAKVLPDSCVSISVKDNGEGIPRSEHRRIFEKFYRIDDRLARSREGSGLGLSIVKHIIDAHRGRVELVSEPGKGSQFSVIVPVAAKSV